MKLGSSGVVDAPISGGPHDIEAIAVTLCSGATEVAAQLGVDLGVMDAPDRVLADLLLPEHRAPLLAEASA